MRIALLSIIVRRTTRGTVSPRRLSLVSQQAGIENDPTSLGRIGLLSHLACVCAAAVLVNLTGCSGEPFLSSAAPQPVQAAQVAQPVKPAPHAKKPTPKPEPTQQELFEYIRSKLLSLSASDGLNDNLEVAFDPETSVLSVTQPDGRCDIFLSSIDTNSTIWESIDPSDSNHPRAEVLRLTMNSMSGKTAKACYDTQNRIEKTAAPNRARLFFSFSKANGTPDFAENMDKAIKKLIVQCGGAPEEHIL